MMITNPDVGQTSPLLALSEELVGRGHQVLFVSGAVALKRVQASQRACGLVSQATLTPSAAQIQSQALVFFSLGESLLLTYLDEALRQPERFRRHCMRPPGEMMGFVQLYTELIDDASPEYLGLVHAVRDLVEQHDPHMLLVDNFSPFAVDGVRLTRRAFISTAPGATSSVASRINPLRQPLPMSGARSDVVGLVAFLRNVWFILMWLHFVLRHPWSRRRRAFREEHGLALENRLDDSMFPPGPGVLPQQIATLSFSVAGMDVYPASAYHPSVFFVGPCLAAPPAATAQPPALPTPPLSAPDSEDAVLAWLQDAYASRSPVVYVNMGSIYFYSREDYDRLRACFVALHERMPSVRILWKIPARDQRVQPVPSAAEDPLPEYMLRVDWVPDVHRVLAHPALAVVMHHGGGNSYNEAVAYGVTQFCVSQWVDTHDIGLCVQHAGVGLWADKSPAFVVDDMVPKLERLLKDEDMTFRRTAFAWGLRAAQAGGARRAADLVEAHMASRLFDHTQGPYPGAI